MNTTDKLKLLLARCRCGVFLQVNQHRDFDQTAEQALEEMNEQECPPDLSDDVRGGILATDTIIELQFYPDTPIGFHKIVHFDLDAALDQALEVLDAEAER
jgi:hypothetical protein